MYAEFYGVYSSRRKNPTGRGKVGWSMGFKVTNAFMNLPKFEDSDKYSWSDKDTDSTSNISNNLTEGVEHSVKITDSNGLVGWIIEFPNNNCYNTNPDDEHVFSCDNIYFRVYLLDPLYGESIDLSTTLYKNCQP